MPDGVIKGISHHAHRPTFPWLIRLTRHHANTVFGNAVIEGVLMLFMVIETFGHDPKAVYRRFREKGRQTPDGLEFMESWVTADFARCFQLMRCDDVTLLQRWVAEWCDLGGFEIVPVVAGRETAAALDEQL
jgi:hypothetical protein